MFLVQTTTIVLCGDWVSAIVDIIMLIFTILSVGCAFVAYGHQKARSKKDSACVLAKHYADSIINKYSDIVNVFLKTGISEDVKKLVDLKDIKVFDKEELERLTENNVQERENLIKKLANIDPYTILEVRMSHDCSASDREVMLKHYTEIDVNGKVTVQNGIFLQREFLEEITRLLNELEWFSMNCRYRLADEKLLYQSLHQTYLSTIWLLYFCISIQNNKNEDKLYTNVTWLFNEWRDRLLKITQKTEKRKQRYLKKANSVKTPVYSGKPL